MQSKAKARTRQDRTGQDKTGWNRTIQDSTGQDDSEGIKLLVCGNWEALVHEQMLEQHGTDRKCSEGDLGPKDHESCTRNLADSSWVGGPAKRKQLQFRAGL